MIKTVTELVNEGWSRKLLYQIAHSHNSPAFKTSEKGHWRFDEEGLKDFARRKYGRAIV